jgi:signal transduction histidine kinase
VLSELQSVLGVLRQDESILPTTPAPGLRDVPDLVESFRAMGSSVELVVPEHVPGLSPTAGVAAFRLVQEALTNVQKHATGASATVTWSTDGDDVEIAVTNARPPSEHPHTLHAPPAGSSLGLVGMLERVLAAGGSLVSGPTADGGFRVAARLPLAQEES